MRFIYRDYPLPFHNYAQKAAEAAECADEQDKFWEYHHQLFEHYNSLSPQIVKEIASELNLDTKRFNKCLDSGAMISEIMHDQEEAHMYGVSGTPAFFINGELITGAQPFSVFKQAIDRELK